MANEPSGGEASPLLLFPQQASVPSILIPQLWRDPELTEVNSTGSGVSDWAGGPHRNLPRVPNPSRQASRRCGGHRWHSLRR